MAGIIIGGFDKYNGGQVFVIPLGGTLMKVPFAIGGTIFTELFSHPAFSKDKTSKSICQSDF